MGAARHMNEASALKLIRDTISTIPFAQRTPNSVWQKMRQAGHPIGYARVKASVEQHGLFDEPQAAIARLVHVADLPVKTAAHKVKDADTLAQLEALANEMISALAQALPGLKIENPQQLAIVANCAANLVKIGAVARDTLASLGEPRPDNGSIAGQRFGAVTREELLERFKPKDTSLAPERPL